MMLFPAQLVPAYPPTPPKGNPTFINVDGVAPIIATDAVEPIGISFARARPRTALKRSTGSIVKIGNIKTVPFSSVDERLNAPPTLLLSFHGMGTHRLELMALSVGYTMLFV